MKKTEHNSKQLLINALSADNNEYVHFLKLDAEKRERVLTAAYDEFLAKGYGEASTNVIIQKAGISKGLLFHYFGSKAGLYKFLMKESTRRIASESLHELPDKNTDVFALLKSIIQLKITVCLRYPKETKFMIAAWGDHLPENLSFELRKMVDMSGSYVDTLIELLDSSLLRDGVEKSIAVEIIAWACEKYTDKLLSSGMLTTETASWDHIAKDWDKYIEALRHGLYK